MIYQRLKKDQPFSPRLNAWIEERVKTIPWEKGDVPEDATYEWLVLTFKRTGKIIVTDAHGDNNIYGNPYINMLFRVWHDWHHIQGGFNFSQSGEIFTAYRQAAELPSGWWEERLLIVTDIVVQGAFYTETSCFPNNQRALMSAVLSGQYSFETQTK